ncbi:hypothetical protein SAMN06269185_0729 [Natronoarchaeum philippinense]|uniref:Halobacterial output domain-containing protein n=1 Tax=Natronoarchaeum philippinense TaxID=558529 RepID=A0A285N697_NATPI|nr:HalOD1 output domain-containing protein [Natronoarchaeum philippinense]SNZ04940.1 hypothetical protein SAMN06269185_0729 [Natronoarchaeum philippinense]
MSDTEGSGPHRFTFDPDERASTAVTEAVADVLERDQRDLPPLYESVDGDSLDSIVSSEEPLPSRHPVIVSFRYAGCDLTVTSHGRIVVAVVEE